MKTFSRLLALTSVSLLLNGLVSITHAAPLSPAGDWDFVMTGKQRGVALITFDPGYTLLGKEILRPAPPANSSSSTVDPRYPTGPSSRTGGSTNSSSSVTSTNFYGGADLTGVWSYNSAGRIIGAINETYYTVEYINTTVTNIVNGTNVVTNVNTPQLVPHVNGVSFNGVVGAGGHLTLNMYTPRGLSTFKGVAMTGLPDYSGNYFGMATKDRPVVEFFSTTPSGLAVNDYYLNNGFGPAYTFSGSMLVSKQKQVALLVFTDGGDLSACTGSYKTNKFTGFNAITGALRGTDSVRRNFPYQLSPRP